MLSPVLPDAALPDGATQVLCYHSIPDSLQDGKAGERPAAPAFVGSPLNRGCAFLCMFSVHR